ncbi:prepilin peptidase-dependent pilin [Yersinia massiliensis]|jgi:prepilin peptidase dependent protein D|uniref:Prepilin peptidase-dependent pilin n=2 Tax=Yersinia TaxID=629 RepID=A0A2R4NTP0_9GAMM|nr:MULTISPECIES: prepilin peptidase-dependent pilin [Yersinia]HEC1650594.1 prepilin peptidase-dependent pilin [Yersinia enterocolitica]ATM84627.1 prepilin peptidase-dependent pilin [Yersinia frederiksenii]AVX39492.1 prepilin peptidase-dependent pilin [Yersinia massiliensis]MCB5317667.1 prepilin peptidase-dependent pilin [Yersinia massiliensis]MDA5546860.1 prepilin peptidase-dependent pilin [Yersinia massiliensis]
MANQHGFTLIELMVAIAIIAVLSGIGIPSYQRYIQKAALTDMLQSVVPYKMAVELCALEHAKLDDCNEGNNGIPKGQPSRYVSTATINKGVITLIGQQTLAKLTLVMSPTINNSTNIIWSRACTAAEDSLEDSCKAVFRFNDKAAKSDD